MTITTRLPIFATALALALPFASSRTVSADQHTSCVAGVHPPPNVFGSPDWVAGDNTLDDPRWSTATALSFAAGGSSSATAPLHARAVQDANSVYMSFISDLTPDTSIPRDVFLGLRRNDATATDGIVIHFHLEGTGAAKTEAKPLDFCSKFGTDAGNQTKYGKCISAVPPNSGTSWYTVYRDEGVAGPCNTGDPSGNKYQLVTANLPMLATAAIAMWQYGADDVASGTANGISPQMANRWAVQIKLPRTHSTTADPGTGVPDDGLYWFEAFERPTATAFDSIAHWPTELPHSVCVGPAASPIELFHPELGADGEAMCPNCKLANFSKLSLTNTGCDKGLGIDPNHIGTTQTGSAPFDTAMITHHISGYTDTSKATKAVNHMVAQVVNTGDPITVPLLARFRVANWGSTATGWNDLRVNSSTPTPVVFDAAHTQRAVSVDWTLTDDELCAYGVTPKGATCVACSCLGGNPNDNCAPSDPGIKSSTGSVCLGRHMNTPNNLNSDMGAHQCMSVELSAPHGAAGGGAVEFTASSAASNWDFGTLSDFSRTAMIDLRGLPKSPTGAQKIMFLVVPRNMPKAVPRATTGAAFLAQHLIASTNAIARVDRTPPTAAELSAAATAFKRGVPDAAKIKTSAVGKTIGGDEAVNIENARVLLEPDEFTLTARTLDLATRARVVAEQPVALKPHDEDSTQTAQLTRDIVGALGAATASKVIPTLEVYPYYLPGDVGKLWKPMPAFSVFLSHEGGMTGFKSWDLAAPGMTKVPGHDNVYVLDVSKLAALHPVPVVVSVHLQDDPTVKPVLPGTPIHTHPPILHFPPGHVVVPIHPVHPIHPVQPVQPLHPH